MGMMDLRRRVMMAGGFSEDTATGNPLTFQTNLAKPLKSLLIPFTPKQASGTPSPSNVLPITGFDGVTVNVSGINLFDKTVTTPNKYINSSGVEVDSPSVLWCITDYLPVFASGKMTYYGIGNAGNAPYSAWYTAEKTLISTFKQKTTQETLDVPANAKYVRFSILDGEGHVNLNNFIVVNGETISEYSAHTGNTYSVTFPASVGTAYDGTLDMATGLLTVDRMLLTLTGENDWAVASSTKFYCPIKSLISGNYKDSTSEAQQNCNLYPFERINTGGSADVTVDKRVYLQRVYYNEDWSRIWVYDSSYTLTTFRQLLNTLPLQITYPIVPQSTQLTGKQIKTLVGQNVLWTDTNGSNTAVFLKK